MSLTHKVTRFLLSKVELLHEEVGGVEGGAPQWFSPITRANLRHLVEGKNRSSTLDLLVLMRFYQTTGKQLTAAVFFFFVSVTTAAAFLFVLPVF